MMAVLNIKSLFNNGSLFTILNMKKARNTKILFSKNLLRNQHSEINKIKKTKIMMGK